MLKPAIRRMGVAGLVLATSMACTPTSSWHEVALAENAAVSLTNSASGNVYAVEFKLRDGGSEEKEVSLEGCAEHPVAPQAKLSLKGGEVVRSDWYANCATLKAKALSASEKLHISYRFLLQ